MANELLGLYTGYIIDGGREDPENNYPDGLMLGRIKVEIPGLVKESGWAFPRGFGGAAQWGKNAVPPEGAEVNVQFINGDIDNPVWEPANHADGQTFPEFVHPDVAVMGTPDFRLVVDSREGQKAATFKAIKEVDGNEETLISITFDIERNMLLLHGETGVFAHSLGQVGITADGDVEIQKRKVATTPRTI